MAEAGVSFPSGGAVSLAALRRPLNSAKRRCGERDVDPQVFQVLSDHLGERVAEQVAQRLVWAMMLESMNVAMVDAERGPAPMFIKRLERAVSMFNRHMR